MIDQRDKSFKIWSYACIGQMRFLTYNLSLLPFHQTILNRLRSGDKFVDAGCCFGQEIRYLVQDGAPAAQLYGFDLESAFIKCGFELFRDQDRLQSTFAHGDILAPAGTSQRGTLDKLNAVGDIVFASSFLHVWDWDEMILAAKGLVAMTQPRPGSTVVGKQLGSYKAGRYKMPTSSGYNYRHNADSIKRFWDQVGRETDSSWTVEADTYQGAELAQNRDHAWSEPDMCMVWFVATRQ